MRTSNHLRAFLDRIGMEAFQARLLSWIGEMRGAFSEFRDPASLRPAFAYVRVRPVRRR